MATSTAPWMSSACGLRRGVLAAVRSIGVVALAVLAVLGALTAPEASLALGASSAALAGAVVRALHRSPATDLPPLPHPAVAATWMAVLPAAVAGTAHLGVGPIGVTGAISAVLILDSWWGGSCPPLDEHVRSDTDREPDDPSLRDLLGAVPIDVLCDEWRSSAGPVDATDPDGAARTRLRDLLLAELHQRDPAGTARWLSEAPGGPPEGYVRDARDRAA